MSTSKIIPFILCLVFFLQCNTLKEKNLLLASDDWRSEIIEFPLDFAPSLNYSGTEYVRFAPGWGNKNASDYFSYVFLWNISQNPELSAKKLEIELEKYFDGLMNNDKFKSKAFFEKINESTYVGKVLTFDGFTTQEQVTLNIIVDYSYCNIQNMHHVLFSISPQNPDHQIWKKIKNISIDIEC